MKHPLLKTLLLAAIFFVQSVVGYASDAEKIMQDIINKYENTDGVDCLTLVKGQGLDLMKMMLRSELGKSFTKGINCITLIDYTKASEETCEALHQDLDAFLSILQEYNVNEEEEFSKKKYMRSFSSTPSDDNILTDFVMAIEEEGSKMIMHMTGAMKIK